MVEELERIKRETRATEVSITLGSAQQVALMCEWDRADSPAHRMQWRRRWYRGLIGDFIAEAKEFAKRFQL